MDIKKILNNMPRDSRDVLRDAVNNYNRTHDSKYAEIAISILRNFDDDSDVRELIRTLKR